MLLVDRYKHRYAVMIPCTNPSKMGLEHNAYDSDQLIMIPSGSTCCKIPSTFLLGVCIR